MPTKNLFKLIIYCFTIIAIGGCHGGSPVRISEIPGPGDIHNYFPFSEGSTWKYKGMTNYNNQAWYEFTKVVKVDGTKRIKGERATVFEETFLDDPKQDVNYLLKTSSGIYTYGSKDMDSFIYRLIPYPEVKFPLQPNSEFVQIELKGVESEFGPVDASSRVIVHGLEDVTVKAGTFTQCIKIENNTFIALTSDQKKRFRSGKLTSWYAPNVGLVKEIETVIKDDNDTSTTELELTEYKITDVVLK